MRGRDACSESKINSDVSDAIIICVNSVAGGGDDASTVIDEYVTSHARVENVGFAGIEPRLDS